MMRVDTSCYYALRRKGGVKVLVTAKNRKECGSSVEYIRLNEVVTDPNHLAQAKKDGEQAAKELAARGGKRTKATGKTRVQSVDPGLPDPVAPEPEVKAEPAPKPKAKKLTAKQLALQKAARAKAAAKKKAAREASAKAEAAAAEAEA